MLYIISFLKRTSKHVYKNETMKIVNGMLLLCVFALITMHTFEKWSVGQTLWWFVVTITTVGYGDASPSTVYGQVSAAIIIIIGIGLGAVLIGNIATRIICFRRNKMNGLGDYSDAKGHIVIMGWREDQTRRIIEQIFADDNRKNRMVILCSEKLETKPNGIKDTRFVKGNLASDDVIGRAGISGADKIIIYGRNDEETILATLGVVSSDDSDKAHITVYIEKRANSKHIERMTQYHGKISVVVSVVPDMLVQEMQDPGVAEIVRQLVENTDNGTIYKVYPHDHAWKAYYEAYQDYFMKKHGAVVFACETENRDIVINPSNNPVVHALYIINDKRPQKEEKEASYGQGQAYVGDIL